MLWVFSLLADRARAGQGAGDGKPMSRYYATGEEDEHRPVTWWNGHPIYAVHLIVIVFVASMLITTVLDAARVGVLYNWLPFDSALVLHGQVWRLVTFGLVNPPSIDFALDMLWMVWMGREVERFFGRKKFFVLFGLLYLGTPLLLTALGFFWPNGLSGERGAFGLFIAFATLYPGTPIFFNLLAKWAAVILVAILSLMALAGHAWTNLLSIWLTVGIGYSFVSYEQGLISLPRLNLFQRKPKLRVLPDLPAEKKVAAPKAEPIESMAEVDALLDKIARSGFASLTAKERAKLDAARDQLRKRESGRR